MVIALVLFTVFKQFDGRAPTADTVTYTQFMNDAQAGRISKVDIQGDTLYVTPDAGRSYSLTSPGELWMVPELVKSGVQGSGKAREEPRSEERRVGKECVHTFRARGSPEHIKKTHRQYRQKSE